MPIRTRTLAIWLLLLNAVFIPRSIANACQSETGADVVDEFPVRQIAPDDSEAEPFVVEETLWGFGSAASMTFNQVALYVRNDTAEVFEGTLWVEPADVALSRSQVTTLTSRDVYLRPGESRWVSFGLFLVAGSTEWEAVWRSPDNEELSRSLLPPTTYRQEQVVAVTDSTAPFQIPTIPPARFPTKSTLLDGLDILVLPDVVTFQPAQEQALAEWLARGGRLVIGNEAREWAGPLVGLNQPATAIPFGAGTVLRNGGDMREMSADVFQAQFLGRLVPVVSEGVTTNVPRYAGRNRFAWDVDSEVFLSLDDQATPARLTFLFYPLLIGYLGVLAWLSRAVIRDRWPLRKYFQILGATVAVTVVLLAWASPLSGRLAGESVSITFATDMRFSSTGDQSRGLGPEKVDLREYTVFRSPFPTTVTLGEPSSISESDNDQNAESMLLSLSSSRASATVRDGRSQRLTAAIPGVTNTFLRTRSVVSREPARWRIDAAGVLRPANSLAESLTPIAALEQRGGTVHMLARGKQVRRDDSLQMQALNRQPDDHLLKKAATGPVSLRTFLVMPTMNSMAQLNLWSNFGSRYSREPIDAILDAAGKAVPAFHRASGPLQPEAVALPRNVARLFVLTKMPDSFRQHEGDLPDGRAFIVWCSQYVDRNVE